MNCIQKLRSKQKLNYIVTSSLQQYSKQYIAQSFSIKYVDQGLERYKINGRYCDLHAQNFLVVNPGQEIEIEVETKEAVNVNGKCFYFDPVLISQIFYAHSNTTGTNLDHIEVDYFNDVFRNIPVNIYGTCFEALLKTGALEKLRYEEQVTDMLISLAEQLVLHQEDLQERLSHLESNKKSTQLELYERIQNGRQYLHNNLSESVSLSKMARAANLSEYYFHRNFRKYYQQTPHQYLTKIRLEKANSLVAEGKYTLKEIASLCGFTDPKYFIKVFKKQFLSVS